MSEPSAPWPPAPAPPLDHAQASPPAPWLPPGHRSPPPPPMRARAPWWVSLSLLGNLVMVTAIIAGFFHVVTGTDGGCQVITKEEWRLDDTFVDLDDYVGKPILSLLPKAHVVRALRRAELITFPDRSDDDE